MPFEFTQYFLYFDEPVVNLRLMNPTNASSRIFDAQIDTGADVSVFDLEVARVLGIDLTNARIQSLQGIGASVSEAHLAEVELILLDDPDLAVRLPIAFLPNLDESGLSNLIGLDVLAHFDFGLSHADRIGYFGVHQ